MGVVKLERILGSTSRNESKKWLLVEQAGLVMQVVAEKNQVHVGGKWAELVEVGAVELCRILGSQARFPDEAKQGL